MQQHHPEQDINTLTIPQVILLTLLATTVTAVAVAVVVVQLMSGVPGETVFQTIERVTETVVERPADSNTPTTVIVKEGDLVARAVADNGNSALGLYYGDEATEVVMLGYGFVVGSNTLVTKPMENPDRMVSAGLEAISTHGGDKIMLWRTVDSDATFDKKTQLQFNEGNPQVGQTLVYLGGDGSIVRGSITGVSASTLNFSENLAGRDMGLMLEVGGEVLGVWTGSEVLRSRSVVTQIDQLSTNPLYEIPDGGYQDGDPVDTNPDDVTTAEKQSGCELLGGTFNEYDECLGIDQANCSVLGGVFESCGSACRHSDDEDEMCTQQCVQYCQL